MRGQPKSLSRCRCAILDGINGPVRLSPYVGSYLPRRSAGAAMSETPLASVFSAGRYVGAILHRGPKGFEAVADDARAMAATRHRKKLRPFCNSAHCTTVSVVGD